MAGEKQPPAVLLVQHLIIWVVFLTFAIAALSLAAYGLHLYVLVWLFRRRVSNRSQAQQSLILEYSSKRGDADWPAVTTQIPLYNESAVARRVIEACAAMDYPPRLHEIQVLDDSDDDTRDIVDNCVSDLRRKGIDISVVRRASREGYKAGALAHGLTRARGKFVAIFDADFVPPPSFLREAVPLIDSDPNMACIQGRWAHLNRGESWLTEAQALGIDGHFAIEQGARAWNGLMMNFNGTAGVWRRDAIDDPNVGGWSGDTLTEDLDLSYRAQLAGWKIDYRIGLACPAELPGTMAALKSQQRRWATGSIQTACKLLPRIWTARLSLAEKLEAFLHLTHYSVSVWMLILAIIARPMLMVYADGSMFRDWFAVAWGVIILSAAAPSLVYTYSRWVLERRWSGLRTIPSMLVLGCGLCVSNTLAVLRGLRLRGGEFVRTPKSGAVGVHRGASPYRTLTDRLWIMEIALGAYCLVSFVVYFARDQRVLSLFLLIYAIGLLLTGWKSRPTPRLPSEAVPDLSSTTEVQSGAPRFTAPHGKFEVADGTAT